MTDTSRTRDARILSYHQWWKRHADNYVAGVVNERWREGRVALHMTWGETP